MLATLKSWLRRIDDYYDDLAVRYPARWVSVSRIVLGALFLILFVLELYRGWFAFFTLLAGVILLAEGVVLLQRQRRWNP